MARPKKKISQNQFESLCEIQCTQEEICSVLGVCDETLTRWCKEVYGLSFSEVYRQKREGGKASLRRTQWKQAHNSATMSIWLGKQYLNQHDDIKTIELKIKELELKTAQFELMKDKANEELTEPIEITIKKKVKEVE